MMRISIPKDLSEMKEPPVYSVKFNRLQIATAFNALLFLKQQTAVYFKSLSHSPDYEVMKPSMTLADEIITQTIDALEHEAPDIIHAMREFEMQYDEEIGK
jgi:hypothetical protein